MKCYHSSHIFPTLFKASSSSSHLMPYPLMDGYILHHCFAPALYLGRLYLWADTYGIDLKTKEQFEKKNLRVFVHVMCKNTILQIVQYVRNTIESCQTMCSLLVQIGHAEIATLGTYTEIIVIMPPTRWQGSTVLIFSTLAP